MLESFHIFLKMADESFNSALAQEEVYTRIKVLGRGAFGEAVLYRKSDSDALVVWKEVNIRNPRNAKEVENEIEILSLLSHPNIIGYLNHYFDDNMLYIEMEYANGGSLYHKIATQESFIPEEIVLWFFYQTVSAIQYLHNRNILHRDVKALNIFLTKSGLAKLGDFGMSKMLENEAVMAQTVVGTPYYMSPELIKGLDYNSKSDMWAVGCVLHEMLTLEKTFMATNTLKLASEIMKGRFAAIDSSYSAGMTELLNLCLNLDADKRASCDEIMLHSLLQVREKEFQSKIANLAPESGDDLLLRSGRGAQISEGHHSTTVPVITSATSELYIWGGGKTQPQKLDTFADGKTALKASIGSRHIAVISVEKELYTWTTAQHGKSGTEGELGHGDKAAYKQPKLVSSFEGLRIVSVACGSDFTVCATESGSVFTFGSNYYGCIGCGDENQETQLIPHEIELFKTEPVKFVACGDNHVVSVTAENRVFSWGLGEFGRLGTGSEDDAFSPQLLKFPLKLEFSQIACGSDCTFFLSSSGKLLACGSNESNKLGFNQNLTGLQGEKHFVYDTPYASVPTLVKPLSRYRILAVASGKTHSACIDEFGKIQIFGSNEFGQLGQGDRKSYKIPKPVKGKLAEHRVAKIACGDGFTVAATSALYLIYCACFKKKGCVCPYYFWEKRNIIAPHLSLPSERCDVCWRPKNILSARNGLRWPYRFLGFFPPSFGKIPNDDLLQLGKSTVNTGRETFLPESSVAWLQRTQIIRRPWSPLLFRSHFWRFSLLRGVGRPVLCREFEHSWNRSTSGIVEKYFLSMIREEESNFISLSIIDMEAKESSAVLLDPTPPLKKLESDALWFNSAEFFSDSVVLFAFVISPFPKKIWAYNYVPGRKKCWNMKSAISIEVPSVYADCSRLFTMYKVGKHAVGLCFDDSPIQPDHDFVFDVKERILGHNYRYRYV